jgi:hypothetical protein
LPAQGQGILVSRYNTALFFNRFSPASFFSSK